MWTADNRPRYNRDKLRYPSDLTDAEWAHIEPLIPSGKPGGGKRRVAIREVINGVMYILSTGSSSKDPRGAFSPVPHQSLQPAFRNQLCHGAAPIFYLVRSVSLSREMNIFNLAPYILGRVIKNNSLKTPLRKF